MDGMLSQEEIDALTRGRGAATTTASADNDDTYRCRERCGRRDCQY